MKCGFQYEAAIIITHWFAEKVLDNCGITAACQKIKYTHDSIIEESRASAIYRQNGKQMLTVLTAASSILYVIYNIYYIEI